MSKLAFRSKSIKVQPIGGLDLKPLPGWREFEFAKSLENSFKIRTDLHSFQEESSVKGKYPEGYKSSVRVSFAEDPDSIARIRREIKLFRVLVVALVMFSVVSFSLNIWIIHRKHGQSSDSSHTLGMFSIFLFN